MAIQFFLSLFCTVLNGLSDVFKLLRVLFEFENV